MPILNNSDVLGRFLASVGCESLDVYKECANLTYVAFDNGIFTVWSVIDGIFFLSEQSGDGRFLNVITPVNRIRRLSEESNVNGVTVLTLELDADRSSIELNGSSNDDGLIAMQGLFKHSGYILSATGDDSIHLSYYAYRFRKYLKERNV